MVTTWYIEHRNGRAHRTACDDPRRFAERVARLGRLGERGELVLVEAASGLVLARQTLPTTARAAVAGPLVTPPAQDREAGPAPAATG